MLTVKKLDAAAHEPPVIRNQCLPAWTATVAEPQKLVAFLPPTFVAPGVQPTLCARPAWAEREAASMRAMPAERTIGDRRLRGGHRSRPGRSAGEAARDL